jgi:hypothetical protein
LDKVTFLKRLVNDIYNGERKSWKEYSNEYLPGDPEGLRQVWRSFKDRTFKNGDWVYNVKIEPELYQKAEYAILNTSPLNVSLGEEQPILSALKPDGTIMNIEEYCDYYSIPVDHVKSFKLVTHSGKGAYYNITSASINLETDKFKDFAAAILNDLSKINTLPITKSRDEVKDPHLLLLSLADLHIGKLAESFETGEDYNNQIAVKRAKEGVAGILNKSSGFPIEKIIFVGGNDILHIDNPKRTTTSGTPQDTDGMWYSNFLVAKQLYIEIIDSLLSVSDVHFVFNPSNHDYMTGFFLADLIKTYYKDCKNITFDCSLSHRKYITYGDNLIGTTHGDGAKVENLPLLMAHESPDWSSCKHRYIYFHHIHHKTSKDYLGVCVESLRSPSSADSWHHRNGYQHAPKAVEGFIHHPKFGQIAKLTHLF